MRGNLQLNGVLEVDFNIFSNNSHDFTAESFYTL